jgi:hypothetical protein
VRRGLEPTESVDVQITVIVLSDAGRRDRIRCTSYEEAIATVKEELGPQITAKIEDREGDIVFTSEEMDIDVWETEWRQAKRRIGVDVEDHECPYGSVGCFADDLCAQCKMDKVQEQF